ncbi:hypothetical protein IF1G_07612 [Cordyceps javanica]|uniref:Uncharacterized protein n=1 Tax=Cordyceps javanica TaxID=43265 RepID=A0A545UWP1_9HYPO|nr:hypothetical protein IF1G_07612 [Cordyceps javanica]
MSSFEMICYASPKGNDLTEQPELVILAGFPSATSQGRLENWVPVFHESLPAASTKLWLLAPPATHLNTISALRCRSVLLVPHTHCLRSWVLYRVPASRGCRPDSALYI